MKTKIHTYENDELTVRYDVERCIHAAECVKGLQKVFDPQKRPWIQPDNAAAAEITGIVPRCPTGALHYEGKTPGIAEETRPAVNSVAVTPDGPLYLRGEVRVEDHEGNLLLEDTRLALCRCGQSANKPLCDGSHKQAGFRAPSAYRTDTLGDEAEGPADAPLLVRVMENGPSIVEGEWLLYSETMQPRNCSGRTAFCRCGGSSNKPFCDGTHRKTGFKGDS